jgi:hypothetical protein
MGFFIRIDDGVAFLLKRRFEPFEIPFVHWQTSNQKTKNYRPKWPACKLPDSKIEKGKKACLPGNATRDFPIFYRLIRRRG